MRPLESFDELAVGQEFEFGSIRMDLEDILDFARRWDPQPFHIDAAAAAAGPFGGIIASGLHTQAAVFSHIIRTGWVAKVSMGGADQLVRWPAPVRPGDEIAVSARIEELTPSRSKPDRGIAKVRYTGRRLADGAVVIDILGTHILRR
ncbi:MaoC/PaaZ C-terminal domain-containing protein [Paracraurococcus lichenis]|uniref:MaoC/PaaZ C-terminal domain-containing protein n=1 Tax=Paracraurococcus lichenis TaxID=3064888 RepID=A0ABT9DX96_9PROT|nr:MaoC/PaaZ C-terminal domain-containing protein [Paracraurococcus sp. LOR1-02]MDO9708513.1 MaoC/PaaZ C-terminal domain-containing protein [Paracraurococcus sp. LOR1-02]